MQDQIKIINAEHIVDPPKPNRVEMDQENLQELAADIKRNGLINPITVRPVGTKFEVVAGHRRFKACLIAGHINIECVVKNLTDDQVENLKASENLYRADLNPVEEAIFLARLVDQKDENIPLVAKRIGKSENWIKDRLDLLHFPDYLIQYIATGRIKLGVAQYLGAIEDEVYRKPFVESALDGGMTVLGAQYQYNLWKSGVLKPGADIMPPPEGSAEANKYVLRSSCEKCGLEAVFPNIKSVWIHKECPGNEVERGNPPL